MKKQTKKLIEENDILCEQLSGEAKDVLRNVTGYIQRFGISRQDQERVRRDIAEMILEGEKRGIPVKDTIGEDYQAFCDSVLAEMPRISSGEKCLNIIRDICIFLAVWLPLLGDSVWRKGRNSQGYQWRRCMGVSGICHRICIQLDHVAAGI